MTRLQLARVVLGLIGFGVWGYAVRVDDAQLRWAGIAILAASVVLRFLGRRASRRPGVEDDARP